MAMDQDKIKKLAQQILAYTLAPDSAGGAKDFKSWLSEVLPMSAYEIQKDLLKDIVSGAEIDDDHIRATGRAIALHRRGKNIQETLKAIADHGAAEPMPALNRRNLLLGYRILNEHLAHFFREKKSTDDVTSGRTDLSEYENIDWRSGISQADLIKRGAENWGKEAADEISNFVGLLALYKRLLNELGIPLPQRGRG